MKYLGELAHVCDGPALLDEAISDRSHKGRHGGHCKVGDEGEQRG